MCGCPGVGKSTWLRLHGPKMGKGVVFFDDLLYSAAKRAHARRPGLDGLAWSVASWWLVLSSYLYLGIFDFYLDLGIRERVHWIRAKIPRRTATSGGPELSRRPVWVAALIFALLNEKTCLPAQQEDASSC